MAKLNPKTLPIAGFLLMILALVVLAVPLLSQSLGINRSRPGMNGQFFGQGIVTNGQGFPGGIDGDGTTFQGTPFPGGTVPQGPLNAIPGGDETGIGTTTVGPMGGRQFLGGQGFNFLNLTGFLNGLTGTIVFSIALLISLAAAVGMISLKTWGKVLGIIMAVLYLLLALLNLVPVVIMMLSFSFSNVWSIVMHSVQVLLAIAIIVLASIWVRKVDLTGTATVPPATLA